MRELIIAGVLGLGAFLVSGQVKEDVKPEVVESVEFEPCLCMVGGECDCDPCLCENCPCKEVVEEVKPVEPIVKEVFVENKFNSVPMEMDIADLKSKVFLLESDVNKLNKDVTDLKSKPHLTEEKVKEIVKSEFKAQLEFRNLKTNQKVTKDVVVKHTGSQIVLEPGEILTHIDGVPVNGNPYTEFRNGQRVMMYRTPSYKFNVKQYSNSEPVEANVMPIFSQFSTCGPNGCN